MTDSSPPTPYNNGVGWNGPDEFYYRNICCKYCLSAAENGIIKHTCRRRMHTKQRMCKDAYSELSIYPKYRALCVNVNKMIKMTLPLRELLDEHVNLDVNKNTNYLATLHTDIMRILLRFVFRCSTHAFASCTRIVPIWYTAREVMILERVQMKDIQLLSIFEAISDNDLSEVVYSIGRWGQYYDDDESIDHRMIHDQIAKNERKDPHRLVHARLHIIMRYTAPDGVTYIEDTPEYGVIRSSDLEPYDTEWTRSGKKMYADVHHHSYACPCQHAYRKQSDYGEYIEHNDTNYSKCAHCDGVIESDIPLNLPIINLEISDNIYGDYFVHLTQYTDNLLAESVLSIPILTHIRSLWDYALLKTQ
jgi:hypothetical protein